jgi:hypothetical protein
MTMREKTMQFRKLGALALLGAGLMVPAAALAVEVISETTIIKGLQGPTATIVVDTNALMAEVQTNMGKGIAAMPSWQELAKLTQLVVDIEFEYNSTAIVPSSYVNLGAIADALHHPLLAKYKFLVTTSSSASSAPTPSRRPSPRPSPCRRSGSSRSAWVRRSRPIRAIPTRRSTAGCS